MDHEEVIRTYVTRIHASNGQNKAETARLTGLRATAAAHVELWNTLGKGSP